MLEEENEREGEEENFKGRKTMKRSSDGRGHDQGGDGRVRKGEKIMTEKITKEGGEEVLVVKLTNNK